MSRSITVVIVSKSHLGPTGADWKPCVMMWQAVLLGFRGQLCSLKRLPVTNRTGLSNSTQGTTDPSVLELKILGSVNQDGCRGWSLSPVSSFMDTALAHSIKIFTYLYIIFTLAYFLWWALKNYENFQTYTKVE